MQNLPCYHSGSSVKYRKVKIAECNTCPFNKWLFIIWISFAFLLATPGEACYAQAPGSGISAAFIKGADSIKTTGMYFNVLKVINHGSKSITGEVTFNGPENWDIIAFSMQTTIAPGDSALIPVRLSPDKNAIGGTAYILSGTFKSPAAQTTANTYITLPANSKWDFSINKSSVYFTGMSPFATFQIHLSNKGNTNELIRLQFDMGKLLRLPESNSHEFIRYVSLPAFKDTIITHDVSYRSDLSHTDRTRYERNWKESSLRATATSESDRKSAVVMFNKLNSSLFNQRDQNDSPLNIDYQLNNLMSSQDPTSNLRVFGSVLYPKNREIQYYAGVTNFNNDFSNLSGFDVNQQLQYSLRYTDPRNAIELGYNIYGGNLHTLNGRGLMGSYQLNKKSTFSYTLTQNPFTNNAGGHVGFSTALGKLRVNTSLIHEENLLGNYSASSVSAGVGFRLLKYHSFNLQLLGSEATYHQPGRDTTLMGFSYRVNYNLQYKKFELRASGLNSANNYIKNSGLQQYYLDSKYTLNSRTLFILYGNRHYYATTRYPYNFDNPVSFNSSDYLRLTTSISSGNITYQVGPDYNGSMRQFYNPLKGYQSQYTTYQPGLWGAVSIRFAENKTITPNATVSNLRFRYSSQDPEMPAYSHDKDIYYSAGINYFDNVWRLSAYYTSGSTSDLYRSIQINTQPIVTKSIQFRPSYENYIFNQKARLGLYLNYAYYMPSGRENTSYNFRYDHFLNKGWSVSASGFLYTNSINDPDVGRISTKDLNFILGVRKSFNLQQPRLKYYTLKAVFFNDLDGDLVKSNNEPPVSNVLVKIEKNREASNTPAYLPETELISDVNGEIYIQNLPKDNYLMQFTPLVNLKSLYFLHGETQNYSNEKNRVLYIPLAESYKIKGKIILVRDENSSEGKIELGGIRVTAVGQKGETFSALTDNFGAYVLNVPNASTFKVKVNNVFGEHFRIAADEMDVQFTQNKTVSLDFTFIESKRGIVFDGGELFSFGSFRQRTENPASMPEAGHGVEATGNVPATYAIQLATSKTYRDPAFFKNKFKLKGDVVYSENRGEYTYFTGDYKTREEARAAIVKMGVTGGIPVVVDLSSLQTAKSSESTRNVAAVKDAPAVTNQPQTTVAPVARPAAQQTNTQPARQSDATHAQPLPGNAAQATAAPVRQNEATRQGATAVQNDIRPVIQPANPEQNVNPGANAGMAIKQGNVPAKAETIAGQAPAATTTRPAVNPASARVPAQPTVANQQQKTLQTNTPVTVKPKDDSMPAYDNDKPYTVQLDVLTTFRDPSHYKTKYGLKEDVLYLEKDGEFRYYLGSYATLDEARAAIARYGLSGYIVQIDRSQLKK